MNAPCYWGNWFTHRTLMNQMFLFCTRDHCSKKPDLSRLLSHDVLDFSVKCACWYLSGWTRWRLEACDVAVGRNSTSSALKLRNRNKNKCEQYEPGYYYPQFPGYRWLLRCNIEILYIYCPLVLSADAFFPVLCFVNKENWLNWKDFFKAACWVSDFSRPLETCSSSVFHWLLAGK